MPFFLLSNSLISGFIFISFFFLLYIFGFLSFCQLPEMNANMFTIIFSIILVFKATDFPLNTAVSIPTCAYFL